MKKEKSGLIIMVDLLKWRNGLIIMGDLPKWKNKRVLKGMRAQRRTRKEVGL